MQLKKRDRTKIERALCTLVDYERIIKENAHRRGANFDHSFHDVCEVLRDIADGDVG
jgi:hypothetical protein